MKSQFVLRKLSRLSEKNLWDLAAEEYSKYIRTKVKESDPVYQEVLVPRLVKTIKNFKPRAILDIGCGDGWFTNLLSGFCNHVTGVDFSGKMISLAAETYPRCRFFCLDATKNSLNLLPGKKFDVVVLNMSLQDISNPEKVILNAIKTLSNKGIIVISIPHPAFYNKLTSRFFEGIKNSFDFRNYIYRSDHVFFKKMAGGKRVFHYHRPLNYYFRILFENDLEILSFEEIFSAKSPKFNEIPFAVLLIAGRRKSAIPNLK